MNNTPVFHDLVLLGGGHSHLTVIKKFGMYPINGLRVTLINKDVSSQYSGMLPGLISGKYLENEVQINLAYLCQYYNIRFIIVPQIRKNFATWWLINKSYFEGLKM